ncbi:MAG: magnesium transporter CorA family protein [Candidatus Altiarchaeota archaeon]|nr:magnesium transporter CorA family protein [Candidatus Altiarchaeota archaeon]
MLNILFKKSRDADLKSLEEPLAGSWINVVKPTKKEISFLMDLGVPRDFIGSSLDPDEQPRIDEEGSARLIILKLPHLFQDRLETLPIGIIFTDKYVITLSQHPTKVLESFLNNPKGFYTTKRTRFLFQIFWVVVNKYLKYLGHIDKKIDNAGVNVTKSMGNEEIINLLEIQKALIFFKNGASGNQRVINKIMTGKFIEVYGQDEDILDDIIIDNQQALEMIGTYLDIIKNTMDAYAGIVGNNLNVLMKLLAVLSISMAIPTMIASFYGMNVVLPFQTAPHIFGALAALSIFLSVMSYYVFFKLKWV